MKIKKIISLFLAAAMLVTFVPAVTVNAAKIDGFRLPSDISFDRGNNLVTSGQADKILTEWPITNTSSDYYELTYHIDDRKTHILNVKFENDLATGTDYAIVTYQIEVDTSDMPGLDFNPIIFRDANSPVPLVKNDLNNNLWKNNPYDMINSSSIDIGYPQFYDNDFSRLVGYWNPATGFDAPSPAKPIYEGITITSGNILWDTAAVDPTTYVDPGLDFGRNPASGASASPAYLQPAGTLARYTIQFRITQGQGFSFRVDGKDLNFKWEINQPRPNTDIFRFQTQVDRRQNGYVYDFTLNRTNTANPSVSDSDVKLMMNNNNESYVTSLPFDSSQERPGSYQAWDLSEAGRGLLVDRISDPPNQDPWPVGGSDTEDDKSAGIYVVFDEPKMWDFTTNTFTQHAFETTTHFQSGDLPVAAFSLGGNYCNIALNDIRYAPGLDGTNRDPGSTDALYPFEWRVSEGAYGPDPNNRQIIIKINEMPPSTIYHGSSLSFYSSSGNQGILDSRLLRFDEREKFYTYMAYKVVPRTADTSNIVIKPYKFYTGVYALGYYRVYLAGREVGIGDYANSTGLQPWYDYRDTEGSKDIITMSLNVRFDSDRQYIENAVRVGFSLQGFVTTGDMPVMSQILNFKIGINDLELGAPRNFGVVTDAGGNVRANVVANADDSKYDTSLLLELEWDINNQVILNNLYFNQGVTEVEFIVYRWLQPPIGDPKLDENKGKEVFAYLKLGLVEEDGFVNIGDIWIDEVKQSGLPAPNDEITATGYYRNGRVHVMFEIPIKEVGDRSLGVPLFYYPGTFFLTVENTYTKYYGTGDFIYNLGESLFTTLTINGISKVEVPIARNVAANWTPSA